MGGLLRWKGGGHESPDEYPAEAPSISFAEGHADDAKQVLALTLAAAQRERSAADQMFVRARQLVLVAASLFGAAQAAAIANVGRESLGALLLSSSELTLVGAVGVAAALQLFGAVAWLFLRVDRARKTPGAGAHAIAHWWAKDDDDLTVPERVAVGAIKDLDRLSRSNASRRADLDVLVRLVLATGATCVAQFALLYLFLAT